MSRPLTYVALALLVSGCRPVSESQSAAPAACTDRTPVGAQLLGSKADVSGLAGRFELETVSVTARLAPWGWRETITLRVPRPEERHFVYRNVRGNVVEEYDRDLLGERVRVVDGRAYRTPIEVRGNQLVLGSPRGFDASPDFYVLQWRSGEGFGGRWANYMTGLAVLRDSTGTAVDSLVGYFCARRLPGDSSKSDGA